MKKITYVFIAIIFLVFGYWSFKPKKVSAQIESLHKGLFEEVLRTEGRIRSHTRETITAFASGDIDKIELRVGDVVKKGQKITVLKWDYNQNIKSPIDGIVSKVFRESAGPVNRAEPLLEVVKNDDYEVVMELLTSDAARARLNQKVRLEGWGGEPIEVKISKVSKTGFVKKSALGVEEERTEVVAAIDSKNKELLSKLGDNFHVDCTLFLNEVPDSLLLPIGAVFKINDKWAVYKVEDNRAKETYIELAERGVDYFRLISGLKEGDEVIIFPEKISDGTLVR